MKFIKLFENFPQNEAMAQSEIAREKGAKTISMKQGHGKEEHEVSFLTYEKVNASRAKGIAEKIGLEEKMIEIEGADVLYVRNSSNIFLCGFSDRYGIPNRWEVRRNNELRSIEGWFIVDLDMKFGDRRDGDKGKISRKELDSLGMIDVKGLEEAFRRLGYDVMK